MDTCWTGDFNYSLDISCVKLSCSLPTSN